MNSQEIVFLYEKLGSVVSCTVDEAVFGNYVVEIRTFKNKKLIIVCDRGQVSAYRKTKLSGRKKALHKNAFNNAAELTAYLESIL